MAYPRSTKTLERLLQESDSAAERAKNTVQDVRNRSSVGPVRRDKVLKLSDQLTAAIATWAESTARGSALASYAQTQKGVPVAPQFAAMVSAAEALNTFIATIANPTGPYSDIINVTSADMAQFITLADTFIATIG